MKKFKEFINTKKLPIGFMGLRDYIEDLPEIIKNHAPNLPTGFIGFLRKDSDDLGNPENLKDKNVKEEAEHDPYRPSHPHDTIEHPDFTYPKVNLVYHPYMAALMHPTDYEGHEKLVKQVNPLTTYNDPEIREQIKNYTGSSIGLNRYLIDRHLGKAAPDLAHDWQHHHLMRAAALTPTQHDMTVFSGVGATHPGKHPHILLPAFTSTSTSAGVAVNFSRHDDTQHVMNAPHIISQYNADTDTRKIRLLSREHARAHYMGQASRSDLSKHYFGNDAPDKVHNVADINAIHHMVHAHLPAGSHMILPHALSQYSSEQEVIIPPGTTMKRAGTPHIYSNGLMLHHVTLHTPKLG